MFKLIKNNLTHKILPILALFLLISFLFITNRVEANLDFICNNNKYSLPDLPTSYEGVDLSEYKIFITYTVYNNTYNLYFSTGGMWFYPYDGDTNAANNRTMWILGSGYLFKYNPSDNSSWVFNNNLRDTKYWCCSEGYSFYDIIRYSNFDIKNRSGTVVFTDNSNSILPINPYIADTDSTISNMTSDYLLIFPRRY